MDNIVIPVGYVAIPIEKYDQMKRALADFDLTERSLRKFLKKESDYCIEHGYSGRTVSLDEVADICEIDLGVNK